MYAEDPPETPRYQCCTSIKMLLLHNQIWWAGNLTKIVDISKHKQPFQRQLRQEKHKP